MKHNPEKCDSFGFDKTGRCVTCGGFLVDYSALGGLVALADYYESEEGRAADTSRVPIVEAPSHPAIDHDESKNK
jgi:hypothetical protein